jgi:hypothetical protein
MRTNVSRKLGITLAGVLALLIAAGFSSTFGSIVIVPPGLNPGDTYRLAFVTDGGTYATSSDIAYYNAFVTSEALAVTALADLGTTWAVIGSTATLSAKANTGTDPSLLLGVPIFGLDGVKIVDNNIDLWDGTLDTGIHVTPTGANLPTGGSIAVWTGTDYQTGGASNNGVLGAINSVAFGAPGWTDFRWTEGGSNAGWATTEGLYGMSGLLVAPAVAPEPDSAILFATGILALALQRRTGRR